MSMVTRMGLNLVLKVLALTMVLLFLGSPTVYAAPLVFVADIGAIEIYNANNGDYLGQLGDTAGDNPMGMATHPDSGNLLVGFVLEVAAIVLYPAFFKVARGDSCLFQ